MKKILYYIVLLIICFGSLAGYCYLNVLLGDICSFRLGKFLLAALAWGTMCVFKPLVKKLFKIQDTKE
jgi:predicted MFS family arabinose efflux permease